jgi:hypothetical protein
MPEHNLFTDLVGAIILPLFILLILAGMAGAKPDTILTGYFKLVGGLLQAILQVTIQLIGLILRELVKLMAQRRAVQQQANASSSHSQTSPQKPRVTVIVNED